MPKSKIDTPIETTNTGVLIEIPPLLDLPCGYLPRSAKADLNRSQRETLKRLTETLMSESAMLADGNLVRNKSDAIRWLLDQIRTNSGT